MGSRKLWQEMLPGENGKLVSPLLEKQYDVIYGSWPTRYDEIMLVVDRNGELADLSLYALGLIPKEYMESLMRSVINKESFEYNAFQSKFYKCISRLSNQSSDHVRAASNLLL